MSAKLDADETLFDHEILEMLLYNACPRMNTNPVAHALLERFVNFSEMFSASMEELMTVSGVGESVARYLKVVGLCYNRMDAAKSSFTLKTFGECSAFASARLKGRQEEFLELYLTEKSGRVKRILNFTSQDRNKVTVTAEKIIKAISLSHPSGVVAAHNHLNGSPEPSASDDNFTKQLQLICSMNGVNLIDHIICADGEVYSYYSEGKLDSIKRSVTLDRAVKWISDE
ncbi:MAG: hypothetical protein K2I30_06890 [Clostridia bacterium]|nr:hypothetical protein [Clostridia bacterium]